MKFREKRLCGVSVLWFVLVICVLGAHVGVCDGDDVGDDPVMDMMPRSGPHVDDHDGRSLVQDEGVGEKTRFTFDPKNPKNVALIAWAGAWEPSSNGDGYDAITIGTFIATNAIVCVPSAQIPIRAQNTSNWYVDHVVVGSPPTTISKDEFVVIYHQKFKMKRNYPHRIAMVVLNEKGEEKATGMVPLLLTAIPFLPTVMEQRHDDFVLGMCVLILYETSASGEGKFAAVPFVATACRFDLKANWAYKEKVCGYTKMMTQTREVISEGIMFPNDLGAPLICGNVLVGIYAGIQNLDGNRYPPTKVVETDRNLNMGPEKMGKGEQYTFDVPGGLKNFQFLGAFVDQNAKNMTWSMKMPMHESNECIEFYDDDEEDEVDRISAGNILHDTSGPTTVFGADL